MSRYLRGNTKKKRKTELPESVFARIVLANLGGSSVYIEPKKAKKFLDTEKME